MKTLLFLMTSLGLANVSAESLKIIKCQNQKVVRFLEIQKKEGVPGCETVYTKEGVARVEGKGQNTEGCQLVLGNIQANLEKAHWQCKDLSQVAVYTD